MSGSGSAGGKPGGPEQGRPGPGGGRPSMAWPGAAQPYGDVLSQPFWAAAAEGLLAVQRCAGCGHHQFYPRPFCLVCERGEVEWVEAAGTGTIYSLTTVHLRIMEELEPPYLVALVRLDEGPILLTRIVGAEGEALVGGVSIGDPVTVAWHRREGAPPLPVFRPAD